MTDFTDEDVTAAQDAMMKEMGWYSYPEEVRLVLAAVLPAYTARVRAEALREASPRWWVATDALARGGEKIVGPFHTQEIALVVRQYVEKSEGHNRYWVDEDARADAEEDK